MMGPTPRSRSPRYRIVLAALALWLALAAMPPAGVAATASPVDLAAILLMPADAEAEGRAGMRLGEGRSFMTIEEAMSPQTYAYSRIQMNLSRLPGADGVLRDAGWQRFHELSLVMVDTSRTDDASVFDVVSSIEEYATADGAARAFDAVGNEQALNEMFASTVHLVSSPPLMGDQSVVWSTAGISDVSGSPTSAVTQMVRVGNRIVSTALIDYTSPFSVDPLELERLMGRLLARVEQVGTAGQPCPPAGPTGIRAAVVDRTGLHLPGLSTCVLRLTRDEATPNRAGYTVVNGTAIQLWTESPEELAERQAEFETTGVRDQYQVQYIIERDGKQAFYYAYIDTYRDEATATSRFDGLEKRLRADSDALPGLSFEPGMPTVGDASTTYSWTTPSTGHAVTSSAVRINNTVVTIRTSQTTAPIPAVTQSLLLSQVTCMEARDCRQPITVPTGIVPALAT